MRLENACWTVRIEKTVKVCVRPTLAQMTTYVLLEQEDWFEDEIGFVRRYVTPGMNAFDIGANHGVYGLSIAARVETGRVWAFEPTRGAGEMLARSIVCNGFADRMTWVDAGLSDHTRRAFLTTSLNSELSTLHGGVGEREEIRLLTLDGFLAEGGIDAPIGFVKLDVEGEEIAVLKGGRRFFSEQSPLVMFELKHGDQVNHGLIEQFRDLGYGIYRLLVGPGVLTEYDPAFQDGYLLNLFACKADRAADLEARDMLAPAGAVRGWLASHPAVAVDWVHRIQHLPYARQMMGQWASNQAALPPAYQAALSAALQSEQADAPAVRRVGLLHWALERLDELCRAPEGTDAGVWLTKLTLLHRLGFRTQALEIAGALMPSILAGQGPAWPFLVPLPEYADREPVVSPGHWLVGCLAEFLERRRSFSSFFAGPHDGAYSSLLANPNHSLAMDRRAVLTAARYGQDLEIFPDHPLLQEATSPNAAIWRRLCYGNLGDTLLQGSAAIHVVDVGASTHGKLTEPYAPLMLLGLAHVTGFEPNGAECAKLNQMYAHSGQFRYLPAFVGKGGPATFHETNWFMTGSLLRPNRPLLESFEGLGEVVQLVACHPVQTVRLADLAEIEDMDLLKIDVQGAELEVFEGAGEKLDQALVIWTEVEFLPLYENQPLFSEVERYLRERGFLFYAFDGIASRAYRPYADQTKKRGSGRSQALWADAIFVRDFRTLDTLETVRLKKLAVLLDMVVRSRDLCHRVLALIDQREGTDHARTYLGAP